MASSDYEKALELVEELHPAAQVLAKAQKLIRDPNVEVTDIEKLLKTDASITTDILRLANSAYYGYATPAKELNSAISRIGFQELLKLVGLSISKNLFAQDLLHYNLSASDYWAESVSLSLLMEVLSRFMADEDQEAYTIGLLSSVGKVVINQVMDIFGEDAWYDGSEPVTDFERNALGFDHSFAGAMILKRWEFPSDITNAILQQYKIDKQEEPLPVLLALNFARKVIAQTGLGFKSETIEFDENMQEFMMKFFIDEHELLEALHQAGENFEIIKGDLGIE